MKFTLAISMCDPSHYVPLARAAEAAGWDGVCVSDGGPWTETTTEAYGTGGQRWWGPETAFPDPFVMIAAMGAVTERVRFYTNVYKLPTRSPLHTARSVASAWSVAPHRVGLGIGLGWNREEFDALGIDFDSRASRCDEALGIVLALLRGEWVEHQGRHFTIPRLRQAPIVPEPLPIYVGGDSPAAMRRAARVGNGWIARAPAVDDVIALVPRMREALAREGRGFEDFEVMAMCPDAMDEASLLVLADGGVDEVEVWPWNRYGVGLGDLPGKLDSVARFAEEVIEPVRGVLGG